MRTFLILAIATFAIVDIADAQQPTTTTRVTPQAMAPSDFANAKAMPLPQASKMAVPPPAGASSLDLGTPGASPGSQGSGQILPSASVPKSTMAPSDSVTPEEFGTSGQVYTTSWANERFDASFNYYPLRAAGKLFFKIGANSFVCSASLIKPGVIVTAAHCVANFGHNQFYGGWQFVPAYFNGGAPYGVWSAVSATVMTAYFNGSDSCAQSGVICQDDMALIVLGKQAGRLPGPTTGWYGYGWGGYSYSHGDALITQLGYPVALDGGLRMERTDSQGFADSDLSNNTIIGSLMTGGSSGGPWMVNFGMPPLLSGVSFGNAAAHNIVVGVTSWGYVNQAVKQEGASPFTAGNIVVLVNAVCGAFPSWC